MHSNISFLLLCLDGLLCLFNKKQYLLPFNSVLTVMLLFSSISRLSKNFSAAGVASSGIPLAMPWAILYIVRTSWVDLSACHRYLSWKEWCKSYITWRVYMFSGVKRVSLSSFLMFKLNNMSLRGTSNLNNWTLLRLQKSVPFFSHTMESNELVSFQENPCTDLYALCFLRYFQNAWWWFSDSCKMS